MYDYAALCYGLIDDYTTMGMPACAEAWLDLFACASMLDCAGIAAGPDVSCPTENAAIGAECPVMPPPPPPP
jgi:hypothetical protein